MFAKVLSSTIRGLDGVLVEVETDILNGLPSFSIVGLPDKAVEESKERVRSALKNTSAMLPAQRITVNLAPGDLVKEGPAFDLPIAVSILLATAQLTADVSKSLFLGELSLNGSLRKTRGILPMVLLARDLGIETIFIPEDNKQEAGLMDGVAIYPAKTLQDVVFHLSGQKLIEPLPYTPFDAVQEQEVSYEADMRDIHGQEYVKRAIEIAVAGGHNILLKGPPGAGKTLIARTLPSILPPLTFEEALEVTKIYSISGLLDGNPIINKRPFRSPHHTTSHIGLIGGSASPRPGEISLAHRGVLFLDEFPEFPRQVLEALRQPLEDGHVVISRARDRVVFPTRFMLVAAANPCPCGYYAVKMRECSCAPSQILRYHKRLSGPILDRIDIHVDVPVVEVEKLTAVDPNSNETSAAVRKRVLAAREKQAERLQKRGMLTNSEMNSRAIKDCCDLSSSARDILKEAMTRLSLSARSYHKIIKIAQTIADLDSSATIEDRHVLEALQYRPHAVLPT